MTTAAPDMEARLQQYVADVEGYLATCLDDFSMPPRLKQSMLYSLLAGGKRLRPVLCMNCALLCGGTAAMVLPFAAAIEMVHTYSLIHDDLPVMDNDDLRRGKPANHKAFDEATAVLAGDALLTDAFVIMCRTPVASDRLLSALSRFALAAGSSGMAGGQEWDMIYTGQPATSLQELQCMHAMKTGALIRASCVCGAMLAGADERALRAIDSYGTALGAAFQITDDILDVVADTASLGKPSGSDVANGKNTYPVLLGLEKSRELVCEQSEAAKAALMDFPAQKADFLLALVDYLNNRAK
ncbi:farnesyl-diphosphate synthase [Candidatus Desulfovibrio trichonymphae]|uniref:Farnesyl-diphosphate synthase n=2 Tax=Candidatus Desulfovibrio trichonymphae TaxID=1725232 RepID=A0A1J1DQC0_9BACT|nr:farnesyl-diphosphate synthase [Candidatus Desulfovibrio trichonymphae]